VTHPFVGKRRQQMTGNGYQSPARKVTRGAKIITMNTTRIGHRTPAAPPSEAITDAAPQVAEDRAKEDHPHETGQNHQAPLAPPARDTRSASDPQAGDETPLHHEAEPDRVPSRERDEQAACPAGTPNGEPKATDCQPESESAGSDGRPAAPPRVTGCTSTKGRVSRTPWHWASSGGTVRWVIEGNASGQDDERHPSRVAGGATGKRGLFAA
jgi:hypothetical protein